MDFFGSPAPLPGFRNLLIDGNFAVNQRGYASGVALGAHSYAHDRWQEAIGNTGAAYFFFNVLVYT